MSTPHAERSDISDRLIIVEERQREMTKNVADLTNNLKTNTKVTLQIQRTLDELTGVRKFLMWFTGFLVGLGAIIAALWYKVHNR